MRNIETLLDELRNHPDLLTAEIFLRSDLAKYIAEDIADELDEFVDYKDVEEWIDENKSLVINNIQDVVCDGYKYMSPFQENVEAFKKQVLCIAE